MPLSSLLERNVARVLSPGTRKNMATNAVLQMIWSNQSGHVAGGTYYLHKDSNHVILLCKHLLVSKAVLSQVCPQHTEQVQGPLSSHRQQNRHTRNSCAESPCTPAHHQGLPLGSPGLYHCGGSQLSLYNHEHITNCKCPFLSPSSQTHEKHPCAALSVMVP